MNKQLKITGHSRKDSNPKRHIEKRSLKEIETTQRHENLNIYVNLRKVGEDTLSIKQGQNIMKKGTE